LSFSDDPNALSAQYLLTALVRFFRNSRHPTIGGWPAHATHQSRRRRKGARLDGLPWCPGQRSLMRFSGRFSQPARKRGSDQDAEEHRKGRPDRKDLDDGNDQHDFPLRARFGSPTSCIQPPARCTSYAAWPRPFRLAFRRCRSIETFSPNTLARALRPPIIVAVGLRSRAATVTLPTGDS